MLYSYPGVPSHLHGYWSLAWKERQSIFLENIWNFADWLVPRLLIISPGELIPLTRHTQFYVETLTQFKIMYYLSPI